MRFRALIVGCAMLASAFVGAGIGIYAGYAMTVEAYRDDPGSLEACIVAGQRAIDMLYARESWRRALPMPRIGP